MLAQGRGSWAVSQKRMETKPLTQSPFSQPRRCQLKTNQLAHHLNRRLLSLVKQPLRVFFFSLSFSQRLPVCGEC